MSTLGEGEWGKFGVPARLGWNWLVSLQLLFALTAERRKCFAGQEVSDRDPGRGTLRTLTLKPHNNLDRPLAMAHNEAEGGILMSYDWMRELYGVSEFNNFDTKQAVSPDLISVTMVHNILIATSRPALLRARQFIMPQATLLD